MKTIFLLSISIFITVFTLQAQSNLSFSVEANAINNFYSESTQTSVIQGPDDRLLDLPGISILVNYQLSPVFSFSTGFRTRPIKQGYRLVFDDYGMGGYSPDYFIQFPFKVTGEVKIWKDILRAMASIGSQFGTTKLNNSSNPERYQSSGGGSISYNDEVIISATDQLTVYNKAYLLALAEAGLIIKILPKFDIKTSFSYNHGFTKLVESEVNYQYRNEDPGFAKIHSNGTYTSFNFGLRYHLR